MHDVDLRRQLEQLARQMRQAAGTGGGKIEFSGLGFGERNQLLLAGTLVATTSISGTVAPSVIGARSFSVS